MANLLFISTVTPAPRGGGPEQRSYHTLRVLSTRFRVFTLVTGQPTVICKDLSEVATAIAHLPMQPWRDPQLCWRLLLLAAAKHGVRLPGQVPEQGLGVTRRRLRQATGLFPGVDFARIHAFRLWNAPFAGAWAERQPAASLQLDLDELDSAALEHIARRLALDAHPSSARRQMQAARGALAWENHWLARFPRIFVSSQDEARKLAQSRVIDKVCIVPNVYEMTAPAPPPRENGETFTFLFVGSFAYYPNLDAARFFIEEILPRLSSIAPAPVRLVLVGRGLTPKLAAAFSRQPAVTVVGEVASLHAWYANADAVVVPLRAGGGTRIKILEAFAHQRPVVATRVGAEGLAVEDQRHLLLADTAEAFSAACLRLMGRPELRQQLVDEASRLVSNAYSPQVLDRPLLTGVDANDDQTP